MKRVIKGNAFAPSRLLEETKFDEKTPYILTVKSLEQDDIAIPHYGNSIEILVNFGNLGVVQIDDFPYDLEKCKVLYIPPNHIHSNNIKAGDGMLCVLKISVQDIVNFLDLEKILNLSDKTIFCKPFVLDEYKGMDEAVKALIADDGDDMRCVKHLLEIFNILEPYMSRNDGDEKGVLSRNKNESLIKLLDFTERHFSENMSNKSAADHIGYNEVYFCRWFRRETGMTYNEYLMLLKINYACKMLEKGKRVSDVVTELGYSNTSFFIRKFKEYVGCTPLEYAKKFETFRNSTSGS